ncbi:hypothetical protein BASA81_001613 [Batrachochytrium salamandrivorans]|nr:hypothetical protein BASA81_001613 [Batrachochytrium salamandrivorans]
MSKVSELKKLFDNNKVVLTPEQHALALRAKDRDQKQAVAIAKSRAARFNLKLRSMELDTQRKESIVSVFSSAPARPGTIYNKNRASLSSPSKQSFVAKVEASQALVAAALGDESNPRTAKEAVELAARPVTDSLEDTPVLLPAEEPVKELVKELVEEPVEKEPQSPVEINTSKEGASFDMVQLVKALEEDDADAINKAVVVEFLQEHDPSQVDQVDDMLQQHVGSEETLMNSLADKYADIVQVELQATTEAIQAAPIATTATAIATPIHEPKHEPEDEEGEEEMHLGAIEFQRQQASRIKQQEEAKIAAMDDAEKQHYMAGLNAQAKYNEDKDRMLKSQLNVYGSGGAAALLGGGARGRGKTRKPVQQEYIVHAEYQGGKWEVNG